MEAPWRIELLGWLRATRGEQVVSRFRSQKAATLLGYLAYYRHRSHARDELVELLWPEIPSEAGRRNLRVELTALRHEFEPHGVPPGTVFLADRRALRLNPACVTDVAEFEVALQAAGQAPAAEAARLRVQAAELYWGPLLPGVYEAWVVPERLRQEDLYLQALLWLIDHFERSGDRERAIQFAYQAVNADPLREETHHELIRLHVDAGRRQAALRQFRELDRLLLDEMGVMPAPATCALVESLRARANFTIGSMWEESLTTETRSGGGALWRERQRATVTGAGENGARSRIRRRYWLHQLQSPCPTPCLRVSVVNPP